MPSQGCVRLCDLELAAEQHEKQNLGVQRTTAVALWYWQATLRDQRLVFVVLRILMSSHIDKNNSMNSVKHSINVIV